MKKDLTEIVVILDRSGSMSTIKDSMEGALNEFVNGQKQEPGEANLSLVKFDDQYELALENVPIWQVEKITLEPRGMTRLLDAVGKTINAVGERLSNTPEGERPEKVLVAIITDGRENDSKEFTRREQIQEMIKHQTEVYGWQFTYLGANQDSFVEAESIGIKRDAVMDFAATDKGSSNAVRSMSCCVAQYRSGKDYSYSDDDRNQAMS